MVIRLHLVSYCETEREIHMRKLRVECLDMIHVQWTANPASQSNYDIFTTSLHVARVEIGFRLSSFSLVGITRNCERPCRSEKVEIESSNARTNLHQEGESEISFFVLSRAIDQPVIKNKNL